MLHRRSGALRGAILAPVPKERKKPSLTKARDAEDLDADEVQDNR